MKYILTAVFETKNEDNAIFALQHVDVLFCYRRENLAPGLTNEQHVFRHAGFVPAQTGQRFD